MKSLLKKTLSALMVTSMMLSFASCSGESKYSLSKIKLTETERSWACPEEQYSELLKTYGKKTCDGAMAVATDKDIVYLYSENAKEKDGKSMVSQDTVFDLGSTSKTFTAVAVLQLVEKGKIKLEDTLDKYFPEYETGKKITIYNLLHMRSGIPDYNNNPDPFWNISGEDAANKKLSDVYFDKISDEEFLQAMYQAPLGFEPGTQFEYSNTNYHVLAFIIEKVSGMKYCDYVKKNIFDKCGMKKTTSMATGDLTYVPVNFDELVQYNFSKDGYPGCPNSTRGDSGIHSCLTDMVAFDRALFAGKLLNKNSMEIMLKAEESYCCGLMKEKDGYSHSGSSFTCKTNNRIIESEKFGHIYFIKLERTGVVHESTGEDPMKGTNYTKSTFKDRVFANEYAELKIKLPGEFGFMGEKELIAVEKDFIESCTEEKDKVLERAKKYDYLFYDGNGVCIEFAFLNTNLGAPDDPDYTEEEYLNDYVDLCVRMGAADDDGWSLVVQKSVKVMLGGKEYVRVSALQDWHGKSNMNWYARRLDDDLMCIILISGVDESKIADYEKLFE